MHLDTPCIISLCNVRWQMLPPSGLQNAIISLYMNINAIHFVVNILCVNILYYSFTYFVYSLKIISQFLINLHCKYM